MKEEKPNINVGEIENSINRFRQNNIPHELKNLIANLLQGKNFSTGASFQKMKNFASPFFGIELVKVSGPVSQYEGFISTILKAQPELYQQEKKFSQHHIFKNEKSPMEYVRFLFPIYDDSYFFTNFVLKCQDIIKECFDVDGSEIADEQLPELLKMFDSISRRDFTSAIHTLQKLNNDHTFSIEKREKVNRELDELNRYIKEQDARRKHIFAEPSDFIRKLLTAVNDIQSHIDLFCCYIHRLVHVKNKVNRDFEGQYYKSGSKKFYGDKFLEMCEKELFEFPELLKFIKGCATKIRELRNLQAHRNPKKLSFSKNGKKIIIPRSGLPEYRYDYQKLRNFIISYGNFINKIDIHLESRYETSEDTIGINKKIIK